ncbi:MAG: hypothetical protein FLDDKLPJ_03084 [Phycisphaerae bacterium]|nr:hypothetical protein [Phycisphaerae bacterium]
MPDQPDQKLIIDSDWKAEAQREKERLAETEQKASQSGGAAHEPRFADLLNLLVMQVMASLGGMVGPGGQAMPPDLAAARYFIDLVEYLGRKTQGNLSPEEKNLLDQVLYELRMEFVRLTGMMAPPAPAPQGAAKSGGLAADR